MAKEKNWNDRWGDESKSRRRGFSSRWGGIMEFQDTNTSTHISNKTRGSDHCVLITKSLIKKLLMHKSIGVTTVRLNKMVTCSGSSLSKYPMPNVRIDQSFWVSAKHINKDVWEFYIE